MRSLIEIVALWPAEQILSFVLMLFGVQPEHLSPLWYSAIVGFVALVFWAQVFRGLFALIKRRIFGFYG